MRDGSLGWGCGVVSLLLLLVGCGVTPHPPNPIMPPTVMILPSPTVVPDISPLISPSPQGNESSPPLHDINEQRQRFGQVILLPPPGWVVTHTEFLDSDLLLMSPAHSEHATPPIISLSVGPATDLLGYHPTDQSLDGLMDAVMAVREDAHILARRPIMIGGVMGQMATLTMDESLWGGARSGTVVVAWLPDGRMVELMSDVPLGESGNQLFQALLISIEFL